jgi:hypothetical protein
LRRLSSSQFTKGHNSRMTPSVMIDPSSLFDQKIDKLPCEARIA